MKTMKDYAYNGMVHANDVHEDIRKKVITKEEGDVIFQAMVDFQTGASIVSKELNKKIGNCELTEAQAVEAFEAWKLQEVGMNLYIQK